MSTLTLYHYCKITPSRNAYVYSIETYLATVTQTVFPNFIHMAWDGVKPRPTKVELPESTISTGDINYASVKFNDRNDDTNIWYFFVNNLKRYGQMTVECELVLDTINTYGTQLIANNQFSDKTTIIREHMDRFVQQTITSGAAATLLRKVDPVSEGLSPIKLQATTGKAHSPLALATPAKTEITDVSHFSGRRWYVIYASSYDAGATTTTSSYSDSSNLPNSTATKNYPIAINLVTDSGRDERCGSGISEGINTIDPTQYFANKSVGFFHSDQNLDVIYVKQGNGTATAFSNILDSGTDNNCVTIFYNPSGVGSIAVNRWNHSNNTWTIAASQVYHLDSGSVTVQMLCQSFCRWVGQGGGKSSYGYITSVSPSAAIDELRSSTYKIIFNSGFLVIPYMQDITNVNRTDNRITKIIQLPYCPAQASYNSTNGYVFPSTGSNIWSYSTSGYETLNMGKLTRTLSGVIPSSPMTRTLPATATRREYAADYQAQTLGTLESKLLHSEVFTYRLRYDTFWRDFAMERLSMSLVQGGNVTMSASTAASSKMAFAIDWSPMGTYNQIDANENIIYCSRNNEFPIYNNNYIDYIRTGYNFDQKAKDISNTTRWAQFATGVAGSAVSIGIGAASGNAFAIAGGIKGATTGIVDGVIGNIAQAQLADNAMAKNLAQLAMQPTSVTGSDDLDVYTSVENNALYYEFYQPSNQMESAIYDLFFYCGYSHPVQDVPDFTSRYRFNFVQCKPVFTDTVTIPNVYLDDIKAKYAIGVTHYHYNYLASDKWDWAQSHENWETWIVSL